MISWCPVGRVLLTWPTLTLWRITGIDSHIPDESLGVEDEDRLTGERLTIPCPPVFNIPFHIERRPTDIMRWAIYLAMSTRSSSSILDYLPGSTIFRL